MPHLAVVVDLGEAGSVAAVLGELALLRGCRMLLVDTRPYPSLPFLYDSIEPAPPPTDDHPRLEVAPPTARYSRRCSTSIRSASARPSRRLFARSIF